MNQVPARTNRPVTGATAFLLFLLTLTALTQAQPPAPLPVAPDFHIFYGTLPSGGETAPALVFIHGLGGTAADWWINNDMYALAFEAGYRTAFISLSIDNSRNQESIDANAEVLKDALPKVATRLGQDLILICHSKGALDAQAALLDPAVAELVHSVFTIASPNQGTELADWAFGPGQDLAELLGLLTPGVESLKTDNIAAFRAQADPYFATAGIRFFTLAGTTAEGNPLTAATGQVMDLLVGDEVHDGMVPVSRTRLPSSFANELGKLDSNHFACRKGGVSFGRIYFQIESFDDPFQPEFQIQIEDGFGDPDNTWAWSIKWFQDRLYVGTGRAFQCVSAATSDVQQGTSIYPPVNSDCPPDFRDLALAAEIWQFDPQTAEWSQVFKSPEDIPIDFDGSGNPVRWTAREMGIRGMEIFIEDDGTEALYASGVSASSLFDKTPPYDSQGFPPPRILRTVNGIDWEPIPHEPGTFMGEIVNNSPAELRVRGYRSLVSYDGKLYATASDFRGVGFVIASSDPASGNDAWQQMTPSAVNFPVFTLGKYNGFLYLLTGDPNKEGGYGVYKTNAVAGPPLQLKPVVTQGAFRPPNSRSLSALSLKEFQGKLYVGTNRPTELIRIDPDDVWEVVVGEPRFTNQGYKAPLSGLGNGFGNFFNGHFWQMANFEEELYLGTWDWGVGFRNLPVTSNSLPLIPNFGFDFLRTDDGAHWTLLSRNGFGDALNWGVRSLEVTPLGLFIGTARPTGPTEVWLKESNSGFSESRPERLDSVSSLLAGTQVILSWEAVPGATAYEVYRSRVDSAKNFLSEVSNNPIFNRIGLSPAFERIAETTAIDFQEPAPTEFQSLYFVRARDANGNLSLPSNVVGGPSRAVPVSFPSLGKRIASLHVRGFIRTSIVPFATAIEQSKALIQEGDYEGTRQHLVDLQLQMESHRGGAIDDWAMDEVNVLIGRLIRNVDLVERGLIPLDPLL